LNKIIKDSPDNHLLEELVDYFTKMIFISLDEADSTELPLTKIKDAI